MGCTLLHYISVVLMLELCYGRPIIRQVEDDRVSVDLYYESLCPYSAEFIINGLAPIFHNGLIDIIHLNLYPWGNAKVLPNSSFTCQHGPSECLLNTFEACDIESNPTPTDHFPFVECVERLVPEHKYTQWETCFTNSTLDPQFVKQCSSGKLGKEDYDNLTSYVCKAYKGTPPSACGGSFLRERRVELHPVCYADKSTGTMMRHMVDRDFM